MTRPDRFARCAAAMLALALAAGPVLAQTETTEPAGTDAAKPADAGATTDEGTAATGSGDGTAATGTGEGAAAAEGETAADAAASGDTASGDAAALADLSADTPVATIDGNALTLGELIALRRDLPEQYQALPDEVLLQGLTEQLVDQTLLAQAARKSGLDEAAEVKLSLRNQERAVLADAYIQAELAKRVTPEALKAAYDGEYANAEPVEEIHAAHILVDSEEKAKELRKQLDEGADFAKLARENGTDGTASRGGDLGWFAKGDMVPSFGDAAFALEPGEIGGPVQSPFGWHLIKVEDRRQRPVPSFEEVHDTLLEQVTQKAQTEIITELREAADVTMPEPMLPPEAVRADALIDGKDG